MTARSVREPEADELAKHRVNSGEQPSDQSQAPFDGLLTPSVMTSSATLLPLAPSVAVDLNLDQIITAVAGKREEAERIRQVLLVGNRNDDLIEFRQEIFRDLELPDVRETVARFVDRITQVRHKVEHLDEIRSLQQRQGSFLDAIAQYGDSVTQTDQNLQDSTLGSRGLRAFRGALSGYAASQTFTTLTSDTLARKAELGGVEYCVRIDENRVDVSRYDGEADYSTDVLAVFERFAQGASKDHRVAYRGWPTMNHVGEKILELVARLFPDEFKALDTYCDRHRDFFDPTIGQFAREAPFYLAYLDYLAPLRATGLSFCYPSVSASSKRTEVRSTFDLALAQKCVADRTEVVGNDFSFDGPERIFVVSGPNQGGKTTFARTFGQLHHLAAVGCPVPGSSAYVFLGDRIFTHFEREEDLSTMTGKLEDDLVRMKDVLLHATSESIIVTNEIFTSTSLVDARFLGMQVLTRVVELDALCVYVTFVEDLATFGPSVVSMTSTVDPHEPARRTYKVVRALADGRAYAMTIAERYGLTYENLIGRIRS